MDTTPTSRTSGIPKGIKRLSLLLTLLASVAVTRNAQAQGCVAIHGSGISSAEDQATSSANNAALTDAVDANPWALSFDYRYFNSLHDYIGRTENARLGTGVYNKSNFTDVAVTYIIDPRFSTTFTLPFVVNDRSQVTNGLRYHTDAAGFGDASIEGNGWVFDPRTHPKGNVLLGLGLSIPTGEDNAQGTFLSYNAKTGEYAATQHAVDQSIQPGTGGWSFILDLYAYHEVPGIGGLNVYGSATYTTDPFQDTNGTLTYRSNPYEAVTGITDSYLYRAGLEYKLFPKDGVTVSWGLRMEGVPVKNWFGDSAGFRRPGYSIDWEPGVTWAHKNYSFRVYVPFSILHDRTQSLADQEDTVLTGKYQHGDAFFANYSIITSFSIKL